MVKARYAASISFRATADYVGSIVFAETWGTRLPKKKFTNHNLREMLGLLLADWGWSHPKAMLVDSLDRVDCSNGEK